MHFLSWRPFCLYCSWWLWMSGCVCVLLRFLYTLYLFIHNFQAELEHFFQNSQTSNIPYILFILLSIFMTFSKTASFVSNWSAFPNTAGNSFTKSFVRCVLSSFPHRILETQAPYIFGALILNYMTSKFIYKWKQRIRESLTRNFSQPRSMMHHLYLYSIWHNPVIWSSQTIRG